jgi:uncharacterized membrane protein YbhN (UPF0104 family)
VAAPGSEPGLSREPVPIREAARGSEREERHEAEVHAERASHKLLHGLISLALLIAIVVGLLLAIPGLHGVAHTVTRMPFGWVAAAVGLEVLSCVGYVVAFLQVFERAPVRLGARVALSELAFNAAVSLGGAGSVAVGAWLLVERGANPGRVAERSAVLFLLTSAINVITFALAGLALATGILPGPTNSLLGWIPAAVGTLVFLFFLTLPALIERGLTRRLPRRLRFVLETTAQSIRDTRHLIFRPGWRIVGAIGYLWFDIAVLLACFAAIGHTPPLAAIVLAYQVAYLSNFVPIPGGIGVLDGSMVGALVLYGAKATAATAATLVYHAIALWIPAMWGTIAFLILQRTRERPLTLRPPRAERRRAREARAEGGST